MCVRVRTCECFVRTCERTCASYETDDDQTNDVKTMESYTRRYMWFFSILFSHLFLDSSRVSFILVSPYAGSRVQADVSHRYFQPLLQCLMRLQFYSTLRFARILILSFRVEISSFQRRCLLCVCCGTGTLSQYQSRDCIKYCEQERNTDSLECVHALRRAVECGWLLQQHQVCQQIPF